MNALVRTFDPREFRQVLGSFVTGVTVITTIDADGQPHGLTVNSFSSVSLDPPLILWSQSLTAPSHPVFNAAERFVVNVLAEDQIDISNRFARGGVNKFNGTTVRRGLGGVPLLEDCAAHLECRRIHSYPGGDHVVFIGEVDRIERHARPPLVFGSGRYMVAQAHDIGTTDNGPNIAGLQAVRLATRALVELSDELDETIGLGVWGNKGATIVRWEEASRPMSENLRTGLVLPLLGSATGLAFAAWLPRHLTASLIDDELFDGADCFPDPGRLSQRLEQVRNAGIVRLIGTDQFKDLYGSAISAISAPIFGPDGNMVLALTVIGAVNALDTAEDGRVITKLRHCTEQLSQRMRTLQPQKMETQP